jgi:hypothetical protein
MLRMRQSEKGDKGGLRRKSKRDRKWHLDPSTKVVPTQRRQRRSAICYAASAPSIQLRSYLKLLSKAAPSAEQHPPQTQLDLVVNSDGCVKIVARL